MTTSLADKKILVTGAGGFIGSHLVEELLARGAKVRTFIRYNSRGDLGQLHFLSPDYVSKVEIVKGDLRDFQAVRMAVEGCQVVLHLGALISIPYSYLHPVEVAEVNLLGTLNVLMACRDYLVERLVHVSSSEVYGTARSVPICEDHPLQGQSPYSASKIGADKLVESFFCTYGLPVVTIRPFNTYGPRQSTRAVIPAIIVQALTRDAIKLGNLEARRDFTFVQDTVLGLVKAITADAVLGRQFNLGTGEDISIGDLANLIFRKIGRPMRIESDPSRLRPDRSEVKRLVSDNTLAWKCLGWQPQISLDQGLVKTIDWIKTHIDLYQPDQYEF